MCPRSCRAAKRAHVDAVDQHATFADVVEPAQQVHERGLAAAALADDAHRLAGLDLEVDVAEHRLVPLVAEGHVLELDPSLDLRHVDWRRGVGGFDRRVEEFEHALAAGEEVGQPGGELRQRGQRRVEHGQIGEEGHERPERHLAVEHLAPADVPHDEAAEAEDERHRRREGRGRVIDVHPALAQVAADAVEPRVLAVFLGKGLHHAHAREHAGEHAGLLRAGIPEAVVLGVHALPEEPTAGDHQRRRDERVDGQLGVEGEQHRAHGGHLHELQQEAAGDLLQQALDHLAVVRHAAGDRADLVLVVIPQAERVELVDQFGAQVEGECNADAGGQPAFDEVHDAEHDARRGQGHHDRQQSRGEGAGVGDGLAVLENVVDQILLQLRGRQLRGDRHEHQAAHHGRVGTVGPQHLPQAREDFLARNAPRASFARYRQALAADLAVRGLRACFRIELQFAGGAKIFQISRDAVEAVGLGVGVAGQVDPLVVDVRLEKSRADGALRAKLLDLAHGHVRRHARPVAVGHRGHVVAVGN